MNLDLLVLPISALPNIIAAATFESFLAIAFATRFFRMRAEKRNSVPVGRLYFSFTVVALAQALYLIPVLLASLTGGSRFAMFIIFYGALQWAEVIQGGASLIIFTIALVIHPRLFPLVITTSAQRPSYRPNLIAEAAVIALGVILPAALIYAGIQGARTLMTTLARNEITKTLRVGDISAIKYATNDIDRDAIYENAAVMNFDPTICAMISGGWSRKWCLSTIEQAGQSGTTTITRLFEQALTPTPLDCTKAGATFQDQQVSARVLSMCEKLIAFQEARSTRSAIPCFKLWDDGIGYSRLSGSYAYYNPAGSLYMACLGELESGPDWQEACDKYADFQKHDNHAFIVGDMVLAKCPQLKHSVDPEQFAVDRIVRMKKLLLTGSSF
jgi:hypothetical protein